VACLGATPIYHRQMTIQYPPIGSKCKEFDLRANRTGGPYDGAKRQVRIACLENQAVDLDKARALQGEERRLCFAYAGTTVKIESEIHARSTRLTIPEPV
jgi:hypothetical protein